MKNKTSAPFALGLLHLLALLALPLVAFAQVAAPDAAPLIQADTAAAIATPFIVALALKAPWVITILAVMGGLRFFFKPILSLVEAYVKSTPQTTDDEYFDKVEHSRAFKIVAWALDFFASVKVGPQFTATPDKKL
jgi:hypothetical protein